MSVEDCAELVANYLIDNDLMDQVEFAKQSDGFKIKLDVKKFPEDIASALRKCSRDMVTTFGGTKLRVRFISNKVLDQTVIEKLKNLQETLEAWCQVHLTDLAENRKDYADQFYAYANNVPSISDVASSFSNDQENSFEGRFWFSYSCQLVLVH